MQEMVLKENGRVKASGDKLCMEFLSNGCGLDGSTGFHGLVELLG